MFGFSIKSCKKKYGYLSYPSFTFAQNYNVLASYPEPVEPSWFAVLQVKTRVSDFFIIIIIIF
jgi:hypothetical protein